MITKYIKIKIEDVTQTILNRAICKNLYNLKTKTENNIQYTILEFNENDIPVEMYILGYQLLTATEALTELSNEGWS